MPCHGFFAFNSNGLLYKQTPPHWQRSICPDANPGQLDQPPEESSRNTDGQKATLGGRILRTNTVTGPCHLRAPTPGGSWLGGRFSILRKVSVKDGVSDRLVVQTKRSRVPFHS